MRYLIIIAAFLVGCSAEPLQPKNELKFEVRCDWGNMRVLKDGKALHEQEVRGVQTYTIPAAPGGYTFNFVSMGGMTTATIYHNDTLRYKWERYVSSRVQITYNYNHK